MMMISIGMILQMTIENWIFQVLSHGMGLVVGKELSVCQGIGIHICSCW